MNTKNKRSKSLLIHSLLMLTLIILGRGGAFINSAVSTDFAYSDSTALLVSYISEILSSLRIAAGISVLSASVYSGLSGVWLGITILFAFLDYAARFLIDFFTGAIAGAEAVAAVWLLLAFLYEVLFILIAVLISGKMRKKRDTAATPRQAQKYSLSRAAVFSVLAYAASKLIYEIYYFISFMMEYSDITAAEYASAVGTFLRVIVIYGGICTLFGEFYRGIIFRKTGEKDTE